MCVCNEVTYNYLIRKSGAITSAYNKKHIDSLIFIMKKQIELFDNVSLQKEFYDFIVKECYIALISLYKSNVSEKKEYVRQIKNIILSIKEYRKKKSRIFGKESLIFAPPIVIKSYIAVRNLIKEK